MCQSTFAWDAFLLSHVVFQNTNESEQWLFLFQCKYQSVVIKFLIFLRSIMTFCIEPAFFLSLIIFQCMDKTPTDTESQWLNLFRLLYKILLSGWLSLLVMSDSLWPHDYTVHGILQARILEWVAFPFSTGSSQSSNQTQVSHIAGGFFTSWATREAQKYWSGQPMPSWMDLPNPGIEPESPASQVDSLPTE